MWVVTRRVQTVAVIDARARSVAGPAVFDLSESAAVPFSRLFVVELRKSADTRATSRGVV